MGIIYKVTLKDNGKSYIGFTRKNIKERINGHIRSSKSKSEYHFHRAIRKYGIDNFKIEILEENVNESVIYDREKYWIEYFDTFKKGYNMTIGGDGYSILYGHTIETKQKISDSQNKIMDSGLKKSQETYIKRNKTLYDKDKDFLKNIGKKSSETQKKNGKHAGKNNSNFNENNILLFNNNGDIIDKFLFIDMKKYKEKYPIRMVEWCLRNKKPMYLYNKPRKEKWKNFIGWYACYENECFCNIINHKRR